MTKYIIQGGKPLHGQITVSSAKNAAVAILAGVVLAEGPCVIENLPKINDITVQLEILRRLGAKIEMLDDTTVRIDCAKLRSTKVLDDDLARQNRASYYFIGALLGRYRSAQVCMPGGCNLGVRAIDQHLKGFEALGARVATKAGCIVSDAPNGMRGAHIYLDMPSVGATINIMLAATRTPGLTIIENPAKEPHVVDLANFLNTCGADIRGAGTDMIKIRGARTLHGCTYSVIPDQIEAGTFIAAVAACGGEITLTNVIPKHLDCFATKFLEMGVELEDLGDAVLVRRTKALIRANFKTMPYPGFPTDMQPPAVVALCLAGGTSIVNETIFNSRFRYLDELKRMGARVQADGQIAIIEGVSGLTGAPVQACDLRAGAALVIAGLAAAGETEVSGIAHIERGYENFVEKLQALGGDIRRVEYPDIEELEVNA
ncbi:MAG: UDP-N-acetylglucosamine 1-carboxyvinyltransferase [Clostridiaceae bacterium]|nr:UDP-N-acetylglucosamine 1-carboxyvinyltransferase [Clostridiaceae bacterium]